MADSDSDRDPWCFLQGVECAGQGVMHSVEGADR